MTKEYYIYRHIRLDKNTPFHVGKGKDKQKRRMKEYWNKEGIREKQRELTKLWWEKRKEIKKDGFLQSENN